ncbi:MAG TPA: thiazole synthase, partial [Idiomarina loihiensis]|nr:thiazole synthase [Idiomarina loihiensis]
MLKIADRDFHSRLLIGSGKYSSADVMQKSLAASASELVTLALKRVELERPTDDIVTPIQNLGLQLLPNTSGAKTAQDAIFAARLAREALGTHWLKLEIHPDP